VALAGSVGDRGSQGLRVRARLDQVLMRVKRAPRIYILGTKVRGVHPDDQCGNSSQIVPLTFTAVSSVGLPRTYSARLAYRACLASTSTKWGPAAQGFHVPQ